jgi:hypothetical protein
VDPDDPHERSRWRSTDVSAAKRFTRIADAVPCVDAGQIAADRQESLGCDRTWVGNARDETRRSVQGAMDGRIYTQDVDLPGVDVDVVGRPQRTRIVTADMQGTGDFT